MCDLEKYRTDKDSRVDVAYLEAQSDQYGSYDGNEKARYSLLIELQYHFRDSDKELLRFLFEQEIIARERDGFQGITNALRLGAFLLARLHDPNDIPLFYRAKNANFDTHCGFDIEFVFWPLKDATDAYLAENYPEILSGLKASYDNKLGLLNTMDAWWADQLSQYPDSIDKESPLVLYDRNIYLENTEAAKKYLDLWAAAEPETDEKRLLLERCGKELEECKQQIELDKAAQAVKHSIDSKELDSDKVSSYIKLIDIHTQFGAPYYALKYVEKIDDAFKTFDQWKETDLGSLAVQSVFDFSQCTDYLVTGKEAFNYANTWTKELRTIPVGPLESGIRAARKWKLFFETIRYKRLIRRARSSVAKTKDKR